MSAYSDLQTNLTTAFSAFVSAKSDLDSALASGVAGDIATAQATLGAAVARIKYLRGQESAVCFAAMQTKIDTYPALIGAAFDDAGAFRAGLLSALSSEALAVFTALIVMGGHRATNGLYSLPDSIISIWRAAEATAASSQDTATLQGYTDSISAMERYLSEASTGKEISALERAAASSSGIDLDVLAQYL